MKITNKTNLRTDQLQNLIKEVAKREIVDLKDSVFTIIYRRGGRNGIAGYAYYGSPARVTLKVPKDFPIDKAELAYVTAHEFCHTQGLRHKQMKNAIYSRRYAYKHNIDWRQHYLWANDLPLEVTSVKVAVPVPKSYVVQQKKDKCKRAMDKWEKKVERSQNCYLKWRRKFMYYEGQLLKVALPTDNLS